MLITIIRSDSNSGIFLRGLDSEIPVSSSEDLKGRIITAVRCVRDTSDTLE